MTKLYDRVVWTALRLYKLTLSPLIGRECRYLPTCSEYAAQALVEHGPVGGALLAVRRICRCRPLGAWGYDPPPPGPRSRGAQAWKCEA
jgi:putative membrane protein insertion efficiency factor